MPAPAYIDWLYDAVCFKASHNSYLGPNGKPQDPAKWTFKPKFDAGCRGFELDLYQCKPDGGGMGCEWSVSHEGEVLGKGCWPLKPYLEYLRKWSQADPLHDPIFVSLDLKSVRQPYQQFAEDLDAYLDGSLKGQLFTPGNLLAGGAPDLVRAVRDPLHGWPPIASLLGKIIFCLSGTGTASRAAYAAHHPAERLCFADLDRPEDVTLTQETLATGHQVVINVPHDQMFWGKNWLKYNPGFLLRVYGLGPGDWSKAVGKGPNVLATDYVTKLKVGAQPFVKG